MSWLLNDNGISIGTAIRKLKQVANVGIIKSESSSRSLRRWAEDWKKNNIEVWSLNRKGEKFLKDNILPSILRADEYLNVADVLVADGHTLAFDIVDPKTGKPKRMTWIVFFDWASRYPVGASIANTEDSEHILLALRNSILNLGAKPRFVYLDNGKAFKSKLFHEKWKEHNLEEEMCGVFPRLGIEASFAQAYNARAKVIERFFLTFQNDFERFMDTFRGSGINDKPAYLMRNEKWIQKLRERKPLEIDEAKQLISLYCTEMYGKTEHSGLNNRKPLELFESFIPEESRKIDANKLNFLMLKIQNRIVSKEGIRLNNALFWHEKLVSYVGQPVILRYDIMDMRSVLVYTEKEYLLCQAVLRTTTHPFIKLAEDKELAEKDLRNQIKTHKRLEKEVKEKSALIRKQVDEACSEIVFPVSDIQKSVFNNTPMLEQTKSVSANQGFEELSAGLEKQHISADAKSCVSTVKKDDMAEFNEYLKSIGID